MFAISVIFVNSVLSQDFSERRRCIKHYLKNPSLKDNQVECEGDLYLFVTNEHFRRIIFEIDVWFHESERQRERKIKLKAIIWYAKAKRQFGELDLRKNWVSILAQFLNKPGLRMPPSNHVAY